MGWFPKPPFALGASRAIGFSPEGALSTGFGRASTAVLLRVTTFLWTVGIASTLRTDRVTCSRASARLREHAPLGRARSPSAADSVGVTGRLVVALSSGPRSSCGRRIRAMDGTRAWRRACRTASTCSRAMLRDALEWPNCALHRCSSWRRPLPPIRAVREVERDRANPRSTLAVPRKGGTPQAGAVPFQGIRLQPQAHLQVFAMGAPRPHPAFRTRSRTTASSDGLEHVAEHGRETRSRSVRREAEGTARRGLASPAQLAACLDAYGATVHS